VTTRTDIIMRSTKLSLIAALAATAFAACTVKDVDTPPLAGPSSLARTIIMVADRDTLVQDGVSEAAIRLSAVVQPGQSENVRLRAQVSVDGVPQDFGTLSNKNPITPTTIFYRAPAPPPTGGAQVATTVTIMVTPDDSGDFRGEFVRQLDLRLIPLGVILPTNPNLVPNFTVSPDPPKVMDVVTFDASGTTNGGAACASVCTYAWDFGDGTTAAGLVVTHQFRRVGTFLVKLTATDARGASAVRQLALSVGQGDPPTASFTTSPATPGVNQDIFFNATGSRAVAPRTIVSYEWVFGDGNFASGSIVTHRYTAPGNYSISLTVTDDAGSIDRDERTLQVGPTVGAEPVADLQCTPSSPKPNQVMACNASASRPSAGSNIVSYTFNWGDGGPEEVHTNPLQTHTYVAPGTFVVTLTVRDSSGKSAFKQQTVTVTP
jgi:PKD repeat protein